MWCLPFSFSKDNKKDLVTPWKLGLINKSKYQFWFSSDMFCWYLFQLIALLKPGFNYWSSFALSWVDKIATGT